jgi:hypothetical protein
VSPGINAGIFGGVSDENLPAAVQGVQEVQALQPKPVDPPELPTAGKEFMFYQDLKKLDPSGQMSKFFLDNWVKKGPNTVVNVGGEPTPFSKKFDESQADAVVATTKGANEAFRALPIIDEAYQTLTKGKVLTGIFAKPSLAVSRMAAAMGVDSEQIKTADTQTMLKLTGEMTFVYLRSRDLGSGTAVSDGDREFVFTLSGRDLSQDKLALTRTLRINYGAALMKQGDALMQLQQDAQSYPERAPQIQRDIAQIGKKYEVGWRTYAKMMKSEGHADEDILQRMMGSGLSAKAAAEIIKMIAPMKVDIQGIGDAVFGAPGR